MKMTLGFETSSTPMVRRLRCSTLSPVRPGMPTRAPLMESSSISASTWGR